MVQCIRICLPVQGTQVCSPVWEDSTCRGATKPVHHEYLAHTLQLLNPVHLEPVLFNKRSHYNEKSVRGKEKPSLPQQGKSLGTAMKTQCKIKNKEISIYLLYVIHAISRKVLYGFFFLN